MADFIDNKEKAEMPGPANYDARIENAGKLKLSKFRTIHNGATGLMFRSQRFLNARNDKVNQMNPPDQPITIRKRYLSGTTPKAPWPRLLGAAGSRRKLLEEGRNLDLETTTCLPSLDTT